MKFIKEQIEKALTNISLPDQEKNIIESGIPTIMKVNPVAACRGFGLPISPWLKPSNMKSVSNIIPLIIIRRDTNVTT